MLSTLLILNGPVENPTRVRALARKADLILAADGGARAAHRLKITPEIVLGDMDSLPRPLPRWKDTAYLCDFAETRSDFEKALVYLIEAGAGPVWIAGALGGRLDHSLVNISLIERYCAKLTLMLVGAGTAQIIPPGRHGFTSKKGETVTLLPQTLTCRVQTRGLHYPLKGETLRRGSRGLSNRSIGKRFELQVGSGRLWVIRPEV